MASLSARTWPGIVAQIAFESGREVRKGDLLVKLDTRQEEAQLHSAQARRELASISLARQKDLIAKKAVAQSDYDSAESEFRQADAAVEEAQALIARKTIVAPFDGLAGIRQVDLGQYLNVGATIAPVQSLDPIYVEFSIPQQDIDKVAPGKKVRVRADGIQDREFEGEITAIDSKVDEATRNVTVQGTVRNPAHNLRPGMYVNVDVLLPEQRASSPSHRAPSSTRRTATPSSSSRMPPRPAPTARRERKWSSNSSSSAPAVATRSPS